MAMRESADKEPIPEVRYLKKMLEITHQERINALFLRIKVRLPELEELARDREEAQENGVYRFTTGRIRCFSFKTRLRRRLR